MITKCLPLFVGRRTESIRSAFTEVFDNRAVDQTTIVCDGQPVPRREANSRQPRRWPPSTANFALQKDVSRPFRKSKHLLNQINLLRNKLSRSPNRVIIQNQHWSSSMKPMSQTSHRRPAPSFFFVAERSVSSISGARALKCQPFSSDNTNGTAASKRRCAIINMAPAQNASVPRRLC